MRIPKVTIPADPTKTEPDQMVDGKPVKYRIPMPKAVNNHIDGERHALLSMDQGSAPTYCNILN